MTKLALITGGNRGLGRNVATSIAKTGGDVIITYLSNASQAQELVDEIKGLGRKAAALQLDIGKVGGFAAFADTLRATLKETFGRDDFDYLVNNAGHGEMAAFEETTEQQFDLLFDVHVKGVFFLTQAMLPLIANGGRIITYSSGLTRVSFPGFSAYSAAKGAIEILTIYLAKELAARGITANCVAPGAIETDFLGGAVRDTPDYNTAFAGMTALGRVGLPEDIGPMIASLLSDANSWVTAQRIEVSGGQSI